MGSSQRIAEPRLYGARASHSFLQENILRDSFVFYRSFYEAISNLSNEDKGRLFSAFAEYALNGIEPELSGFEKSIFTLIKPQIDANIKRYEDGKKGGEHGKKGGRPPKLTQSANDENNPTKTPVKPHQNPSQTPNVNVNVNVNENDHENPLWFEGHVIRLNKKDYTAWQKMTGWSDDYFNKVLSERDDWLNTEPAKQKNWFISTSKYLRGMQNG